MLLLTLSSGACGERCSPHLMHPASMQGSWLLHVAMGSKASPTSGWLVPE